MKVALVYPNWIAFPPRRIEYAMDVVGMELSRELAARGQEVTLYSQGSLARWSTVVAGGVRHRRVPQAVDLVVSKAARARELITSFARHDGAESASAPLSYRLGYGLLSARDLERSGCDIAHVCILDQFVPVVRRLSPRTGIVFHMHDHKQVFRDPERTRRRLAKADLIVGCSEFLTDRVRRRFPELAPRCQTILNAVDPDLFATEEPGRDRHGGKRLLFIGRVSPEKGVHTITEAFELVLEQHPDAELSIVGPQGGAPVADVDPDHEDPRFDELRTYLREPRSYVRAIRERLSSRARERTRFMDPVSHEQTPSLIRRADVVLFPSLWDEPFGLPAVEAMASSVPVVATRVGGLPETIIDGVTGLLVEPGDSRGLAASINRLLADDELRCRMGDAGCEHVRRRFSWGYRAEEWLEAYERVLETRRAACPNG